MRFFRHLCVGHSKARVDGSLLNLLQLLRERIYFLPYRSRLNHVPLFFQKDKSFCHKLVKSIESKRKKISKKKKILYLSVRVFRVFSTVVLILDTVNKQTDITNRTEIFVKNPNWWEADQLAIYKARRR